MKWLQAIREEVSDTVSHATSWLDHEPPAVQHEHHEPAGPIDWSERAKVFAHHVEGQVMGSDITKKVAPAAEPDPTVTDAARDMLIHAQATGGMDDAVRRVLEKARGSDAATSAALLSTLDAYQAQYPNIAAAKRSLEGARDHDRDVGTHVVAKHEAEERAKNAWKSKEWVCDDHIDPKYVGPRAQEWSDPMTRAQIFDSITRVAPELPYEVKMNMVGQAWQEQGGRDVLNNNYFGMEGGHRATVFGKTSDTITREQYEADPNRYEDALQFKHGTAREQYDAGRKKIDVMTHKARPAYHSLDEGSAAYVHGIEDRIKALANSTDEDQRKLGEAALAGDPHAYATIVNNAYSVKDRTTGKTDAIYAWNGWQGDAQQPKSYAQLVEDQIALAHSDPELKKRAPQDVPGQGPGGSGAR